MIRFFPGYFAAKPAATESKAINRRNVSLQNKRIQKCSVPQKLDITFGVHFLWRKKEEQTANIVRNSKLVLY